MTGVKGATIVVKVGICKCGPNEKPEKCAETCLKGLFHKDEVKIDKGKPRFLPNINKFKLRFRDIKTLPYVIKPGDKQTPDLGPNSPNFDPLPYFIPDLRPKSQWFENLPFKIKDFDPDLDL